MLCLPLLSHQTDKTEQPHFVSLLIAEQKNTTMQSKNTMFSLNSTLTKFLKIPLQFSVSVHRFTGVATLMCRICLWRSLLACSQGAWCCCDFPFAAVDVVISGHPIAFEFCLARPPHNGSTVARKKYQSSFRSQSTYLAFLASDGEKSVIARHTSLPHIEPLHTLRRKIRESVYRRTSCIQGDTLADQRRHSLYRNNSLRSTWGIQSSFRKESLRWWNSRCAWTRTRCI
jgi:hypothetical protein